MIPGLQHPASYRDPSGYMFTGADGRLMRYVHRRYAPHYNHLMSSGLYKALTSARLLVPHEELAPREGDADCYRILQPEFVAPWTFPYEWSFQQLREAALVTLRINRIALDHGAILKDATAYNLQLRAYGLQWIDTLSFERHVEGQPWTAFGPFLQHFLYPLLLYRYLPETSPAMLTSYPDGIPPRMVSAALRGKARLSLNHRLYVHLPATMSRKAEGAAASTRKVSTKSIRQNLQQLEDWIGKLSLPPDPTWERYYTETILSDAYLQEKSAVIEDWLSQANAQSVLDLGCNTGRFSLIAAERGAEVTALDTDPRCIDVLWRAAQQGKKAVFPIVADLCQPSPALGWEGAERGSLLSRIAGREMVLALALVHHLAIGRNVPLSMIASLFARLTAEHLIVEWIPKEDEKVQGLLQHRADVFDDYTQASFDVHFGKHFVTRSVHHSQASNRVLYWFQKK
jgi:SAM-dependent methyltransferase